MRHRPRSSAIAHRRATPAIPLDQPPARHKRTTPRTEPPSRGSAEVHADIGTGARSDAGSDATPRTMELAELEGASLGGANPGEAMAANMAGERHLLIDALRGFAVLGIFWRNVFVFGMPYFAYAVPGLMDADTVPDTIATVFVAAFTEGTMRALLSILFGASVLLILASGRDGDDPHVPIDRHFRRLLWLAALGLAHAYLLLWPHDILFLYGVLGLALFPFRRLAPRPLMLIGLALLVGSTVVEGTGWRQLGSAIGKMELIEDDLGPGMLLLEDEEEEDVGDGPSDPFREGRLGVPPGTSLAANGNADSSSLDWIVGRAHAQGTSETGAPSEGSLRMEAFADAETDDELLTIEEFEMLAEAMAAIEAEIEARMGGYADNLLALAPETFEQQTSELFTHHILDIGAMLFVGMALLKGGVLIGRSTQRTYCRLALWGLGGGAMLGVLAHDALIGIEPLMPLSLAIGDYLFDARRLALALGVVGLFGWLAASGRASRFLHALAVPGRMALSLYVMQTVIGVTVFYGFGLGLFGTLSHAELLLFAFLISAVQLWLAHAWTRRFGRGPLERLLARLVNERNGRHEPRPVGNA